MIKRIINKRIKNLTLSEIDNFAREHNIYLTDKEIHFIKEFIQNNPTLIYQELNIILKEIKQHSTSELYDKIEPIVKEYHQKYKSYL